MAPVMGRFEPRTESNNPNLKTEVLFWPWLVGTRREEAHWAVLGRFRGRNFWAEKNTERGGVLLWDSEDALKADVKNRGFAEPIALAFMI